MGNSRNLANLLGTGSTIATAKIADDAITAAKIATDAVVADGLSSSAIAVGDLPAGSVIQVVNTINTTENAANVAADYPQASAFKLSITPTSTSSKVLVIFEIDAWLDSGSNHNKIGKYGIRLNSQSNAQKAEKRISNNFQDGTASVIDMGQQVTLLHLDSPNSTSAQEYELILGRWSSTYDNNVKINGGGFGHSSITLIEIAG